MDKAFSQAIEAGAQEVRPVENQFYGDCTGMIVDPFGMVWSISSHFELYL